MHDYVAKYRKGQPYTVAELYGRRKQPDDMFEWLQRAWAQRDTNSIQLISHPFIMSAYQHDLRFIALCTQADLPLPGQVPLGDAVPSAATTWRARCQSHRAYKSHLLDAALLHLVERQLSGRSIDVPNARLC